MSVTQCVSLVGNPKSTAKNLRRRRNYPQDKGYAEAGNKVGGSKTETAGAQDVARLYPDGKRLLKPGRNPSMAHAPRAGKEVFCRDWNIRGGCGRGDKCDREHDSVSDRNLQWTFAAEMIRRGGNTKRPTRVAPENIDGMVHQLRESNKRTHGGQPMIPSKAWWQKTAGANSESPGERPENGRGESGWKVTKRELEWDTLAHVGGKVPLSSPIGEGGADESSLHRNQSKPGQSEPNSYIPMEVLPDTGGGKTENPDLTIVVWGKADDVRRNGNPAAPEHPGDVQEC